MLVLRQGEAETDRWTRRDGSLKGKPTNELGVWIVC